MQIYEGKPVSPGIVIGEAFIYNQELLIPKYSLSNFQIEFEIERFHIALKKTKEELIELKKKMIEEMSEDEGKFLDSHILMTEDQAFIKEVIGKLKKDKKNVEWIIFQVVDSLVKKFSKMEDEYFQERAIDILDIGRKVMQKLLAKKNLSLSSLDKEVIVISTDVTVSDTASMNKKHIKAFVTEIGGWTSHTSILSRALGIPAVFGIEGISHLINTGDVIIVDGINGKVIVNPTDNKLKEYKIIKKKYEKKENEYFSIKDLPSITKDGKEIKIRANMEVPEQEIESVLEHGAEGIGLYRSEFLYLSKKLRVLPNEEQQYEAYKFILQKFPRKSVTIRTLDLGGDKVIEDVVEKELNPYLGWRAIRFCLAKPKIFKTQLRALYRASVFGDLKIMFPMITGVEEVIEAKKIIVEVQEELRKEKIKFKENVPVGIMIETPAAVMVSGILAKYVDFFSIGTNDLIQYTLACDRGNEKVAYLYEPLHPAILKLIKITIDNAHKENIEVSICGEMAADVENAIVLIGLGIDELSMGSISMLEVKKVIRSISYKEVKDFSESLLGLDDFRQVIRKLKNWTRKNVSFIYDFKKNIK